MTIEIDEKSYVVGVWFSSCPKTNNNWLACVIRDPNNPKKYKGWSRFRYVKDNKNFDSEDEKSWTEFTTPEDITEDEIITILDEMQNAIEICYSKKDRVIIQGNLKKMTDLMKNKEWMHMKMEKHQ